MTFVNHLKGYKLEFSESAKKDLKRIDDSIAKVIGKKLELLISGYQNLDVKKFLYKKNYSEYEKCPGLFLKLYKYVCMTINNNRHYIKCG